MQWRHSQRKANNQRMLEACASLREMRRPGALERVSDLRMRQALGLAGEALELVDDMSPYVPEYFCEKWGFLETYADLLVRLGVLRTQA